MSADVLAVMDAAVARLPDSEAAPLDEARAAVAELIEALVAERKLGTTFRNDRFHEARDRTDAALASVQGEGA